MLKTDKVKEWIKENKKTSIAIAVLGALLIIAFVPAGEKKEEDEKLKWDIEIQENKSDTISYFPDEKIQRDPKSNFLGNENQSDVSSLEKTLDEFEEKDIYKNEVAKLDSLERVFKNEQTVSSKTFSAPANYTPAKKTVQREKKTEETKQHKNRFNYISNYSEKEEKKLYKAQIIERQRVTQENPFVRIRLSESIGNIPSGTTIIGNVTFGTSRIYIKTDLAKVGENLEPINGEIFNSLGKRGIEVIGGTGVEIADDLREDGSEYIENKVDEKAGGGGGIINKLLKKKVKVTVNAEVIYIKIQ